MRDKRTPRDVCGEAIIVVTCPNIEWGGGGEYLGEEQIIFFEHRYKAYEMEMLLSYSTFPTTFVRDCS